jgi:hypothetical protein
MQRERQVLGFLVRGAVSDERLLRSVAQALGLEPGAAAPFDVDGPASAAILVERTLRPTGFRTDVTLYLDASQVSGSARLTSQEVAARVAAQLADEVLVSPPADDPSVESTWLLITPKGERFRASEASPGDEDGSIDIDRVSLRPV